MDKKAVTPDDIIGHFEHTLDKMKTSTMTEEVIIDNHIQCQPLRQQIHMKK